MLVFTATEALPSEVRVHATVDGRPVNLLLTAEGLTVDVLDLESIEVVGSAWTPWTEESTLTAALADAGFHTPCVNSDLETE